jgi:hypothetical protein
MTTFAQDVRHGLRLLWLAAAQSRVDRLVEGLASQQPDAWRHDDGRSRPVTLISEARSRGIFELRGWIVGFATLLMIGVGGVLLIACANLSNDVRPWIRARQRPSLQDGNSHDVEVLDADPDDAHRNALAGVLARSTAAMPGTSRSRTSASSTNALPRSGP